MADRPPLRYKKPVLPPAPIPLKRVFAHVLSLDCACPKCGALHPHGHIRKKLRTTEKGHPRQGYDYLTGIFTCRRCRVQYVLGAVFYPLPGHRPGRLEDTRPTLEEALTLREMANGRSERPPAGRRANLVATEDPSVVRETEED